MMIEPLTFKTGRIIIPYLLYQLFVSSIYDFTCAVLKIMLLFLHLVAFAELARALLVHIDQGALNGTILRSRNGDEFYGFYGIPYAQPPVGELRFQPPKSPPPSWEGTRDATQKPLFCPQMNTLNPNFKKTFPESEDCLYLQVFTKNINADSAASALQPVLVFFHGGGFFFGSSTLYEPAFLMDKPIVVVMVNYRLGVLGFLTTGEAPYPGNYGLKDQSAALRWVQKNIRAFDGDPSAVTLMGHSAGSVSVHHHTFSHLSKGMFHRAILQSGSSMDRMAFSTTEHAQKNFQSFRQHANCSRPSTNESVACLLALPAKELVESAQTFRDVESHLLAFNPAIEPYGSEGAFLPTNPRNLEYVDSHIPLMIGFTSNELLSINRELLYPGMNCSDEKAFTGQFLKELSYEPNRDHELLAEKTMALVKQLYFENNFTKCDFNTTATLLSDRNFKLPILHAISTYSNRSYAYEFDYRDLNSSSSRDFGVGHGGELKFIIPHSGSAPLNDVDRKLSETIMTYWTNFILTGDPNMPNKTVPAEWSPAKNVTERYLRIMYISNNGFQMRNVSMDEKAKLWTYYVKIFWK